MNTAQYDILFKAREILLTVGKSCLLLRFTNDTFALTTCLENIESTIGIEFGSKIIQLNHDRIIKLQIWDTAGQESFRSISRAYYRGAIGCLLVYDITRRDTFTHLNTWLDDVRLHGNDDIKIILVANKSDMEAERQVTQEEGKQFALANSLLYVETSAKTNTNVEAAFEALAAHVYECIGLKGVDLGKVKEEDVRRLEAHGVKFGIRRVGVHREGIVDVQGAGRPVRVDGGGGGDCC